MISNKKARKAGGPHGLDIRGELSDSFNSNRPPGCWKHPAGKA